MSSDITRTCASTSTETLTDQPVDAVGVDLGEDEGDVVLQVGVAVQDGLDRRRTAAEHACTTQRVKILLQPSTEQKRVWVPYRYSAPEGSDPEPASRRIDRLQPSRVASSSPRPRRGSSFRTQDMV